MIVQTTKRIDMTPLQMAVIVALEPILQASGLRLVCEHCAKNANSHDLVTGNEPSDAEWKVDCLCAERRLQRAGLSREQAPVPSTGDLLPHLGELLRGTGLVVRCPNRPSQCLTTPLTFTRQDDGLTARCMCWQIELGAGVYRFTRKKAIE